MLFQLAVGALSILAQAFSTRRGLELRQVHVALKVKFFLNLNTYIYLYIL